MYCMCLSMCDKATGDGAKLRHTDVEDASHGFPMQSRVTVKQVNGTTGSTPACTGALCKDRLTEAK